MKGLKISNESSMFAPPEKPEESFDEKAKKVISKVEGRKADCAKLASQFVGILNDKILSVNKSPITKDIEKEVVGKLVALASEINSDESEDEGMGSMAVITLLMRSILIQRDKINELAYEVDKIKKSKIPHEE